MKVRKEPIGRKRPPKPMGRQQASVTRVLVSRVAGQPCLGKLVVGPEVIPCSLGRAGIVRRKREGDGATPAGCFGLVEARIRGDRLPRMRTALPMRRTASEDGWCDDVAVARYNRPVRLPFRGSHENLWRADGLYDLLLVLDYNLRHPRRHSGSAIFVHVADPAWRPTAGCVALRKDALRRLLPRLSRRTRVVIQA